MTQQVRNVPHILIVEDDLHTAEMLTSYFRGLGYEITHTVFGEEGVELAASVQPDLVMLDIRLPDIDGYETCRRIRERARTMHLPIMFLTERRAHQDRLDGLELGVVDYVTKPFDVEELRLRVRNILQRGKADALVDATTELPTALMVEEQFNKVAASNDLALLGVTLHGMMDFGDVYGFVVHDDVLRAVAVILINNAKELMRLSPFVGQLSPYQFVMVVPEKAAQTGELVAQLKQRLDESISFFYPYQDVRAGKRADGGEIPKIRYTMCLLNSGDLVNIASMQDLAKRLVH